MTFLEELHNFVSKYYETDLKRNGFQFLSEKDGPGMGAYIKFVKKDIFIQFVNDRNQFFVSIGKLKNPKVLWDLDLIMAYFYLNESNNIKRDKKEIKEILIKICNWKNYEKLAKFFFNNIEKILKLFSKSEIKLFDKELNKLLKERRKYM